MTLHKATIVRIFDVHDIEVGPEDFYSDDVYDQFLVGTVVWSTTFHQLIRRTDDALDWCTVPFEQVEPELAYSQWHEDMVEYDKWYQGADQ